MRSIIDFYRGNLVVTAVIVVIAVALAVLTMFFSTGGLLLPVAFALLAGLLVGIVLAVFQKR
ncbi:MAG: hypothetical protein V9E83_14745 [Baekduia sp.]